MKNIISGLIVVCFLFLFSCSKKIDQMDGTYMPYIYKTQLYTPAPEGYEPFYINMICRHGSRYPITNKDIELLMGVLAEAETEFYLTENGKHLYQHLQKLNDEFQDKWGKLTLIGEEEVKGIATRMKKNFPDLFTETVYVQSDSVERCRETMKIFLSQLFQSNDEDKINVELVSSSNPILNFFNVNLEYLKYKNTGQWIKKSNEFADSLELKTKILKTFFEKDYVDKINDKVTVMHSLYSTYAILNGVSKSMSLRKYFSLEDIFNMWQIENVRQYTEKGPYPVNNGLSIKISFPLLEDFLETSNNAISEGSASADFRFAHAETIIPFAALLGIPVASAKTLDLIEVKEIWKDYLITPMAANIQWIFYSNGSGSILVKMLLNESEVNFPFESNSAPYYKWEDVSTYYQNMLSELPMIKSFSIDKKVRYFKLK